MLAARSRACWRPAAPIVALVKPQFEVGREGVGKGGVVRDAGARAAAVASVAAAGRRELGLEVRGSCASPLPGAKKGNVEFFLDPGSLRSRLTAGTRRGERVPDATLHRARGRTRGRGGVGGPRETVAGAIGRVNPCGATLSSRTGVPSSTKPSRLACRHIRRSGSRELP